MMMLLIIFYENVSRESSLLENARIAKNILLSVAEPIRNIVLVLLTIWAGLVVIWVHLIFGKEKRKMMRYSKFTDENTRSVSLGSRAKRFLRKIFTSGLKKQGNRKNCVIVERLHWRN